MKDLPKRSVLHLDGVTHIMRILNRKEKTRFTEMMRDLEKEKNPAPNNAAALSYRLRALEKTGLVMKDVKSEPGEQVRIFYKLTNDGREALSHLEELDNITKRAILSTAGSH